MNNQKPVARKEVHSEWAKGNKMNDGDSIMITKAVARDFGVHAIVALILLWSVGQFFSYMGWPYIPFRVQSAFALAWAVLISYVFGFMKMGGSVGMIRGTIHRIEDVFDIDLDGDGQVGKPDEKK